MPKRELFVHFVSRDGVAGRREFTDQLLIREGHDLVVRDRLGNEIERFCYAQYASRKVEKEIDGKRFAVDLDTVA